MPSDENDLSRHIRMLSRYIRMLTQQTVFVRLHQRLFAKDLCQRRGEGKALSQVTYVGGVRLPAKGLGQQLV